MSVKLEVAEGENPELDASRLRLPSAIRRGMWLSTAQSHSVSSRGSYIVRFSCGPCSHTVLQAMMALHCDKGDVSVPAHHLSQTVTAPFFICMSCAI